MYLSLPMLLLLAHLIYPVRSVQIGRGLPRSSLDVSATSLMTSQHIGYVDQKIRQYSNGYIYLNHEQWHQRNTSIPPNGSSIIPSSFLTVAVAPSAASNTSAVTTPNTAEGEKSLRPASLTNWLHSTEALATYSSTEWDQQTDAACNPVLKSLNGIPSNPSGISACYSIHDFDNSTGDFLVALRLYQIAEPTSSWSQIGGTDVNLELKFAGAMLFASNTRREGRGLVRITLPVIAEKDAKDMYRMRSNGALPKKLSRSKFHGQINADKEVKVMNDTTIRQILTPNITLSGTTQNGTSLMARLPTEDASFVYGFLLGNSTARELTPEEPDELFLSNTNASFSPTSLIITSVWALLLMMTIGYGRMVRKHARDTYRRRVRSRLSGGGGRT